MFPGKMKKEMGQYRQHSRPKPTGIVKIVLSFYKES
jgi:hypothetical protein